jgi:hypothetical protein
MNPRAILGCRLQVHWFAFDRDDLCFCGEIARRFMGERSASRFRFPNVFLRIQRSGFRSEPAPTLARDGEASK